MEGKHTNKNYILAQLLPEAFCEAVYASKPPSAWVVLLELVVGDLMTLFNSSHNWLGRGIPQCASHRKFLFLHHLTLLH